MKNQDLFLFCGGQAVDSAGGPKPLMKIAEDKSLIQYYLEHLDKGKNTPNRVTLLCDYGQKKEFTTDLGALKFSYSIEILESNEGSSTFDKLLIALETRDGESEFLHFSYPDIFFFGDSPIPNGADSFFNDGVAISVATLTSRFPRLVVDIYGNNIKGISDHTSLMPANPLHVFGGDLWARKSILRQLIREFLQNNTTYKPSLEYDLFFWLVNQARVRSLMMYGDWLLVDSARDIRRLIDRLSC